MDLNRISYYAVSMHESCLKRTLGVRPPRAHFLQQGWCAPPSWFGCMCGRAFRAYARRTPRFICGSFLLKQLAQCNVAFASLGFPNVRRAYASISCHNYSRFSETLQQDMQRTCGASIKKLWRTLGVRRKSCEAQQADLQGTYVDSMQRH